MTQANTQSSSPSNTQSNSHSHTRPSTHLVTRANAREQRNRRITILADFLVTFIMAKITWVHFSWSAIITSQMWLDWQANICSLLLAAASVTAYYHYQKTHPDPAIIDIIRQQ